MATKKPDAASATDVEVRPGSENRLSGDAALDALADQADALAIEASQAAAPGAVVAVEEPPGPTNAEVVAGVLGTIRETVCEIAGLQSPRRTLTDETCAKLGAIWGKCLDQYGIDLAGKMGQHAPLFVAVVSSVQLLAPVIVEARKEIAARDRAARPAEQPSAVSQPPGATFVAREDGVIKSAWSQ